jgi:hypothetical protein
MTTKVAARRRKHCEVLVNGPRERRYVVGAHKRKLHSESLEHKPAPWSTAILAKPKVQQLSKKFNENITTQSL